MTVVSAISQGARQLAERFLMTLIGYAGEVACDLQHHALARGDRPRLLFADTLIEIAHWHAEHLGDLEQPAGRDAIDAALVFMRLLIGHADQFGELLLRQSQHDPPLANPRADVPVDRRRRFSPLRLGHAITR